MKFSFVINFKRACLFFFFNRFRFFLFQRKKIKTKVNLCYDFSLFKLFKYIFLSLKIISFYFNFMLPIWSIRSETKLIWYVDTIFWLYNITIFIETSFWSAYTANRRSKQKRKSQKGKGKTKKEGRTKKGNNKIKN
jgi:hypothetical protein